MSVGRLRRLHELSEPSVVNWWLFYCCQLPDNGRRGMDQMEKITTGVSYTTSAVGTGYWFLQLLDRVSPSQWAAIGVLGSLLFGLLTYLTEVYWQ